MTRRVIFPHPDYWHQPKENNTMTDQPAPINRPLTDAERSLLLDLAVRVIADQSGIPHTDGECRSCSVSASVLEEFVDTGQVYAHGDRINCYLDVGPNRKMVHATREWLAFHAEHPEAIDLDKHRRPLVEGD